MNGSNHHGWLDLPDRQGRVRDATPEEQANSYADHKELARQMRELHGYDYPAYQAEHDGMWGRIKVALMIFVFGVAFIAGIITAARGDWTRVTGEWPADMPESTQLWFKNLASQKGWCCNTADGHPAGWEKRGDHYWALYNGAWREVPEDAVITGKGNPTGGAVVFLDPRGNIRCFVPGPEG